MTSRYRAGAWGTGNAVIGAVFLPVFVGLAVLAWRSVVVPQTFPGYSPAWSAVAGTAAAGAALLMVWCVLRGVSTWRPVLLTAGGGQGSPVLSLPVVTVRGGFRRVEVPVGQVVDVRLVFRHEGRQSRWQLVVRDSSGGTTRCDSVTSGRSSTADVRRARAGLVVRALDERVRDLQRR